jgi:hypothetical protein
VKALPLLLAMLLLAGCGGSGASVVTVTRAAAPGRSCAKVTDSMLLCERPKTREYTTSFFVRGADGRLSSLPVENPPREPAGHWVTAYLSPDGKTLLAQWSGECETPSAYFVAAVGGTPRALADRGDESLAHGWTGDGRAIVEFPKGVCGGTAGPPGLYLVSLDGARRLLAPLQ